MSFLKFKSLVLFIKIVAKLLLLPPFGNIQSCNYVLRARALAFVFLPVACLRLLSQYFNANFPLFQNLAIFLILGNCNFND